MNTLTNYIVERIRIDNIKSINPNNFSEPQKIEDFVSFTYMTYPFSPEETFTNRVDEWYVCEMKIENIKSLVFFSCYNPIFFVTEKSIKKYGFTNAWFYNAIPWNEEYDDPYKMMKYVKSYGIERATDSISDMQASRGIINIIDDWKSTL